MRIFFDIFRIPAMIAIVLIAGAVYAQEANENKSIVAEELIFPLQDKHVHSSSIVELPNGDFLAVWFQGSGERTANDVELRGARLKKGETKWSETFPMADTPGLPDCNPILFLNRKGKLFLVWIAVLADAWEEAILRVRTSTDYDQDGPPVWNWQDNILFKPTDAFAEEFEKKIDQVEVPPQYPADFVASVKKRYLEKAKSPSSRSLGWMPRIQPIILKSGRILMPLYSDGFTCGLIGISDDDGETWRPSLPIVGLGIQPALAECQNGDIVAYMRAGPTRMSISQDQGESWSVAVPMSDKPSVASVDLDVLRDGRWVYTVGDVEKGRYRLTIFVSSDEGKTWKKGETIEHDPNKKNSYCYPCLMQAKDGMIHLTYTYGLNDINKRSIKHVRIDPAKLP